MRTKLRGRARRKARQDQILRLDSFEFFALAVMLLINAIGLAISIFLALKRGGVIFPLFVVGKGLLLVLICARLGRLARSHKVNVHVGIAERDQSIRFCTLGIVMLVAAECLNAVGYLFIVLIHREWEYLPILTGHLFTIIILVIKLRRKRIAYLRLKSRVVAQLSVVRGQSNKS